MNDAEHTGQHPVGSLDGRLEGGDLLLAGGGRLGACGWLAEGGRVPRDFKEPLGLREALQLVEPAIDVLYGPRIGSPQLDAAGNVPGRLRDEDLAGPGGGADACRQIHRAADVVAVLLADRLTGVDADTDPHLGTGLVPVHLGDGPLDPDRAQDGATGGAEGDHEAVALRLDDDAAECLDLATDDRVLLVHDPGGRLIAELLRVVREPPDVAEENGDSPAERHRCFGCISGTASLALRVLVHPWRRFRWH